MQNLELENKYFSFSIPTANNVLFSVSFFKHFMFKIHFYCVFFLEGHRCIFYSDYFLRCEGHHIRSPSDDLRTLAKNIERCPWPSALLQTTVIHYMCIFKFRNDTNTHIILHRKSMKWNLQDNKFFNVPQYPRLQLFEQSVNQ